MEWIIDSTWFDRCGWTGSQGVIISAHLECGPVGNIEYINLIF